MTTLKIGGLLMIPTASIYLLLKAYRPFGRTQIPSSSFVVHPTPHATVRATLPELFPEISWEATVSGKFAAYRLNPPGPVPVDGFMVESVPLQTYPDRFLTYYEAELRARGWILTMASTGHGGDARGYENDGYYMMVGIWGLPGDPPYKTYVWFTR